MANSAVTLDAVEAGAAVSGPARNDATPGAGDSAAPQSLAQHLEADNEKGVYAILIPDGFVAKEGAQLWPGVKLGKFLGAGAQAKVFRLARDDGSPTGKVIKINHADLGSKMLNNNYVWVGMDREWEIGNQLRTALQDESGNVPGFMLVADCLVSGGGKCGREPRFSGMIMGELHGFEVYKRMEVPEFCNIYYVREMLFQVFSALDRAQRKLGFVHADLGMRNVMEHYPTLWEDMPAEQAEEVKQMLLDWGPGFAHNADGSRMPLGPEIEFKIIDFGISKLSAKVAAAAAGRKAQAVVEALHERCVAQDRIIFGSDSSPTSLELSPADVTEGSSWMPGNVATKARFRIRHDRAKMRQAATAVASRIKSLSMARSRAGREGSQASGAGSEAQQQQQQHLEEAAEAADAEDAGMDDAPTRLASLGGSRFERALEAVTAGSTGAESGQSRECQGKARGKKSPIEAMYRHWWHGKADVFHLLLTMALVLDDRTWPEDVQDAVMAYCSLTHHVTGIKMRAHFVDEAEAVAAKARGVLPYGRKKWQHWFRRWRIRLKAHLFPFNSGLLAREALSHPFFGAGEVQHAKVPWSVGDSRWEQDGSGALRTQVRGQPATQPAMQV